MARGFREGSAGGPSGSWQDEDRIDSASAAASSMQLLLAPSTSVRGVALPHVISDISANASGESTTIQAAHSRQSLLGAGGAKNTHNQ